MQILTDLIFNIHHVPNVMSRSKKTTDTPQLPSRTWESEMHRHSDSRLDRSKEANLKKREADVEKNDMQTMSARLYTHICLIRLNVCHIREKSSSDVCSYSNMDIFVKSSSLYSCFRRHTSDLKVLSSRACSSRCFYYTQIICRQSDPAHTLIVLDRGVSHFASPRRKKRFPSSLARQPTHARRRLSVRWARATLLAYIFLLNLDRRHTMLPTTVRTGCVKFCYYLLLMLLKHRLSSWVRSPFIHSRSFVLTAEAPFGKISRSV